MRRSFQLSTHQICTLHSRPRVHSSQSSARIVTSLATSLRDFSTNGPVKQQQSRSQGGSDNDKVGKSANKKEPRTPSTKTSLRRVAVEAERSRGNLQSSKPKSRSADHGFKTKTITAYCAAEQYKILNVSGLLKSKGYSLDPFNTGLYPQVIHVQLSTARIEPSEKEIKEDNLRDVFIFPSGTVVAWDVEENIVQRFISQELLPAAEYTHLATMESEDLEFYEDPESEKSSVTGDTIRLGTKPSFDVFQSNEDTTSCGPIKASDATIGQSEDALENKSVKQHGTNLILAKIAFSSGLARSVKLAVLESSLQRYFDSTRSIPTLLSRGSRLPFTRSFILRKTGELLSIRAQLNLYSELTDSLPDLFWDYRHELGLEGYFDQVGRALDVGIRIKTLNEKMDYAQEIAAVLRERLSEKHGLRLEWSIIFLISVEVVFEMIRQFREGHERRDPASIDSLLRRHLQKYQAESE